MMFFKYKYQILILLCIGIGVSCETDNPKTFVLNSIDSVRMVDSMYKFDSLVNTNWLDYHPELRNRFKSDTAFISKPNCTLDISYVSTIKPTYNFTTKYVVKASLKILTDSIIKDSIIYLVNDDQYGLLITGCIYHQKVKVR